jgi:hypothetical protein
MEKLNILISISYKPRHSFETAICEKHYPDFGKNISQNLQARNRPPKQKKSWNAKGRIQRPVLRCWDDPDRNDQLLPARILTPPPLAGPLPAEFAHFFGMGCCLQHGIQAEYRQLLILSGIAREVFCRSCLQA